MGFASVNSLQPPMLFVAAFALAFLQAGCPSAFQWLGTRIDLLPVLVMFAAVRTTLPVWLGLGLAAGLWFDSFSANPIGVSAASYCVIGFFLSRSRANLLHEHPAARMVLGFLCCFHAPWIQLLVLWIARRNPLAGWATIWQTLVMGLAGAIAAPILFKALDWAAEWLGYKEMPEPAFRQDREMKRGRY